MVFQEDQTISLNLVNHSGITSARNNYRRKERENIPVGCKPPAYQTVSWNNSLGVPVQSGPSWTSLNMLGLQGPVQKGLGPGSCTERAMVRALCRRGRGPCLRGCQDPGWSDRPPPSWTEWQTHTTENITFQQLCWPAVHVTRVKQRQTHIHLDSQLISSISWSSKQRAAETLIPACRYRLKFPINWH